MQQKLIDYLPWEKKVSKYVVRQIVNLHYNPSFLLFTNLLALQLKEVLLVIR